MRADGYLADDERFAAAVTALGAGPGRVRRFLDGWDPADAWEALADGRHPADPGRAYQSKAQPSLLDSVDAGCARSGVAVRILGRSGYPSCVASDGEAPAVLFTLGEPGRLDASPRVAVVGTRSATPYGLGVASELGRGLADAGVAVVAGLSRGIDSAAHAGALASVDGGPPVAVIGPAPDAVVHRADVLLMKGMAEKGAVLSERAPGSNGAPPWCFVVRHRVMAALAHVVVVVECHREGGSMHTVKAASDRGVTVMAVPGSVRSSASAGCNALLVEGAAPARHVEDVLAAVELAIAGHSGIVPPHRTQARVADRAAEADAPSTTAARILEVLDHDPACLDTVIRRSMLPLAAVAEALEQLADVGLAVGSGGWWSRGSPR